MTDAPALPAPAVSPVESETTDAGIQNPRCSFFSLPPEIRQQVYGYLLPTRIHISPNSDVQEYTKPWALVSISRQFRTEMRAFAYRVTPIDVHLSEYGYPEHEMKEAFEVWFENMDMGLAASIRHFSIDEFVDINWKPYGPVAERPDGGEECFYRETALKLRYGYPSYGRVDGWRMEPPVYRELIHEIDDWEIRWLKFIPDVEDDQKDALNDELSGFYLRGQSGSKVAVLGKEWIRRFVDACCGRLWDRDTDDRVQDEKLVEHGGDEAAF
ncbi:MAG: hypothetical protein Q9209_001102 [Squamulea sp. 1 TL-2023]